MLAGCQTKGQPSLNVDLPTAESAGDTFKTVQHPRDRPGEDPKVILARVDAALVIANGRIESGCKWTEANRLGFNPKGAPASPCNASTPAPR